MATIAENLQGIIDSKEDIRLSIVGKGVPVPTTAKLSELPAKIDLISGSTPAIEPWYLGLWSSAPGLYSIIRFSATENLDVTIDGNGTDIMAITSLTRSADDIYVLHEVRVDSTGIGQAQVKISDRNKIVALGRHGGATVPNHNSNDIFFSNLSTQLELNPKYTDIPDSVERITVNPSGNSINGIPYAHRGDRWPAGLTHIISLGGTNFLHPSGKWPASLKYYRLHDAYYIDADMIGPLPEGMEVLNIRRARDLRWDYNGPMPSTLKYLQIGGSNADNINWTGLDVPGNSDLQVLNLIQFRTATKLTSAEMVTLLTNLTNRVGDLPAIITINEYADYANPPTEVQNAVAALIAAKSTTTVNLGA